MFWLFLYYFFIKFFEAALPPLIASSEETPLPQD